METKTRILIADSNQDFCRLMTDTFSREKDLEIVGVAGDGVEAMNLLAELKPDLLLMDLVLPKLDGLELLRRLSKSGNRSSIRRPDTGTAGIRYSGSLLYRRPVRTPL